jgi:hypothetical protein
MLSGSRGGSRTSSFCLLRDFGAEPNSRYSSKAIGKEKVYLIWLGVNELDAIWDLFFHKFRFWHVERVFEPFLSIPTKELCS